MIDNLITGIKAVRLVLKEECAGSAEHQYHPKNCDSKCNRLQGREQSYNLIRLGGQSLANESITNLNSQRQSHLNSLRLPLLEISFVSTDKRASNQGRRSIGKIERQCWQQSEIQILDNQQTIRETRPDKFIISLNFKLIALEFIHKLLSFILKR